MLARAARGFRCVAIEQGEAHPPAEPLGPRGEPFTLALDQRVQRIEQNGLDPAAPPRVSQQIVQQRDEKAFGLARASPGGDEAGRAFPQRRGPGVKLMDVGRAVSFPVERTWLIERCDQIRMQ